MAIQVTTRGQITIDRAARRALGVEPGMVAHQRVVAGKLEVVFLPAPHDRSLAGTLGRYRSKKPPLSNDEIERAVEEAIAAESDG